MADTTLQSESIVATGRGPLSLKMRDAYISYRRTKAEWDAYLYATPEAARDDDEDSRYCGVNCEALNALLLTPAENLDDLALKLRIFDAEQIDDNWTMGRPITALLANDAQRIAANQEIERAGFAVAPYARRHLETKQ